MLVWDEHCGDIRWGRFLCFGGWRWGWGWGWWRGLGYYCWQGSILGWSGTRNLGSDWCSISLQLKIKTQKIGIIETPSSPLHIWTLKTPPANPLIIHPLKTNIPHQRKQRIQLHKVKQPKPIITNNQKNTQQITIVNGLLYFLHK